MFCGYRQPIPRSLRVAGFVSAIRNALASMQGVATALGARWDSAHPDRYMPRHLRRCTPHGTREVERAVIDDWLTWRR
jgi:hypothetical protein